MDLLSPISFFILFCLVKLFSVIEINHILILCFQITEGKDTKEKVEESSVTGYLRFSMGRRQDDSEEETWRTEH